MREGTCEGTYTYTGTCWLCKVNVFDLLACIHLLADVQGFCYSFLNVHP